MLNKVILIGRITNDIELRQTSEGTPLTYFTIAVNRRIRSNNNQQQTDFIDCKAWAKTAETMSNYLHKGSLISIEGRIEVFSSQLDNGQYTKRITVVVEQFNFLESKGARTLELETNDYKQTSNNNQNNQEDFSEKDNNNFSDPKENINFASESKLKESDDFDEINFDEINF